MCLNKEVPGNLAFFRNSLMMLPWSKELRLGPYLIRREYAKAAIVQGHFYIYLLGFGVVFVLGGSVG